MKSFLDSIILTLRANRASVYHLELIQDIIPTIMNFSKDVLYPLNAVGDRHGCKRIDCEHVTTPPGFAKAYTLFQKNGWQGMSFPQEYGGGGLPSSIDIIKTEVMATANWSWSMYPGLSLGAARTLLKHGCNDVLKKDYLPKLVAGKVLGTMCLTEPQCGSDLSLITTSAERDGDEYIINGTKIFISCGNHDFTHNIYHCVLARLKSGPPGLKGISLFLVPKYLQDGTFNRVDTVRLESKMGCHGSSTCELHFSDSRGYLVGTENKGIPHMFTFINTSRIGVALQGVAASEMAAQYSLDYALNRRAMRSFDKDKREAEFPADRIIVHPNVNDMIMTMRCFANGGRSMLYECALLADEENANEMELDFLTPILKGFVSEKAIEATQLAIQVYGGHGYIFENKVEQLSRDTRIGTIYEGTTAIQALDLLARKILQRRLEPLNNFCKKTRQELYRQPCDVYTREMFLLLIELQSFTIQFASKAKNNHELIGKIAVDYLAYIGYIVMGIHLLRLGRLDPGHMKYVEHYFNSILPRTKTHMAIMKRGSSNK
jgi:alkylation response protein AidB-like acyl-CoA dehydrogenase